ncbi:site-specific integrase [Bacillus subtilis]|uniref:Integrase n=2 Tax=Zhangjivirus TaxID=3044867 RepID=A0AAE9K6M5_9CAUD|nr:MULTISPECIES: site-specific integrase [Bacillus subtilis group]YP_010681668.1 integrase [Bacillus phage vB_BsuS_PJN02]YP_010740179.1 integrase [Bacillus phage FADO]UPG35846.1 putative integrase/recombinase [Bacillus phage 2S-4]UUG68073.1 site-specific integrase [Bacillus phage PK-3]MCR4361978.1 site-specific integrase [Bacillus subtilis]UNH58393.1 putative site specific recombinase [Bacillus phage vB_BsuS_PJN02]UNY48877.1 integrase [Bacillus phage FADO]
MAKKIEEVTDHFWDNEVNPENREIIENFLEDKQELSPATRKQYTSALKIFAKWIHDTNRRGEDRLITDLKIRDALRYQNWLISKDLSPNAIKLKRSAVSSLCDHIEAFYSDLYPDFRNIFTKAVKSVPKVNKKQKDPLTKKELDTLVKALNEQEEYQKLAYLLYTYSTGCRREESRQLLKEVATYEKFTNKKGEQKNFYRTHPIRAKGKGKEGKVREFDFDERAMQAIRKWLEVRGEDDCPYVFASKTKDGYRQLSPNTFNLWCDKFSEILGKKVHPHLIRSTRATIANQEEGKDIKKIQKMLGHESSQTTEIYIVRDDSDDMDDLYE